MAVIMVVDDEPEVRQLIETVVRKAGHEVVTAADAGSAFALLDREPAAIFVDIDMPGETGVEFVLRLREHPRCAHVPVAFVTAYRERARPLLSTGAEPGVVDVIDKPFRLDVITRTLDRMLAIGGVDGDVEGGVAPAAG
jgi:two-component system, OmpR family, response regulator